MDFKLPNITITTDASEQQGAGVRGDALEWNGLEIKLEVLVKPEKGLTAPRVTPEDIDANIADEEYFTAADGVYERPYAVPLTPLHRLTFCVLTLRNGFTVTGENACSSPENFNAEIGCKRARENAINKLHPMMAYALKQRLYDEAIKP